MRRDYTMDLDVHRSAVMMSEILHYLCQLDTVTRSRSSSVNSAAAIRQRVSPLVFAVRQWAKSAGVTCSAPGVGFSNFMLTTLVIFFLQTRRLPALPALSSIKSTASGLCSFSSFLLANNIFWCNN